jgi:ketosteroid isomerase-like protein
MLVRYAPDVEIVFDPNLQALGVAGTFRGHAAMVTALEQIGEGVEGWDMRPAMCLDTGDRLITLGHVRLPGRASGLVFETEFAQVVTFRRGVIATEHEFWSWEKGLRNAGLDPDAIALPPRRVSRPAVRKPG